MPSFFTGPSNFSVTGSPGDGSGNFAAALSALGTAQANKNARRKLLANTALSAGNLGLKVADHVNDNKAAEAELTRELEQSGILADIVGDPRVKGLTGTNARAVISSGDASKFKQFKEDRLGAGTANTIGQSSAGDKLIEQGASQKINKFLNPGVGGSVDITANPIPSNQQLQSQDLTVFPGLNADEQFVTDSSIDQGQQATPRLTASLSANDSRNFDGAQSSGARPTLFSAAKQKLKKGRQDLAKGAFDLEDKRKKEKLETLGGITEFNDIGTPLSGRLGSNFTIDKGNQGSTIVEATQPINESRITYFGQDAKTRSSFDKEVGQSDRKAKEALQIYTNLDRLFTEARLSGRDPSTLFNRAFQELKSNGDIGGIFRSDDPIGREIAQQFSRINTLGLGLTKENNGGVVTDNDFKQGIQQFGTPLDTPEALRSFGKNVVGIFAGKALDGYIINGEAGKFNELSGPIMQFLEEDYRFNKRLGGGIDESVFRSSNGQSTGQFNVNEEIDLI